MGTMTKQADGKWVFTLTEGSPLAESLQAAGVILQPTPEGLTFEAQEGCCWPHEPGVCGGCGETIG